MQLAQTNRQLDTKTLQKKLQSSKNKKTS